MQEGDDTMEELYNSLKSISFFLPFGMFAKFAIYATFVAVVVIFFKPHPMKRNMPPTPPGAWPILGHLPLLGKQPHITMENWANNFGEIYMLWLGSVSTIVVSSPAMAKQVLLTQDKTWASRPKSKISEIYFSYNYRGITFAQYSPMWRQLRKIATLELLTPKRLEATEPMRIEEMQQMLSTEYDYRIVNKVPDFIVYMINLHYKVLAFERRHSIVQDIARGGKLVDIRFRVNIKVANEIFRMVLGHRFSGSIGGANEEADAEGREFKNVIDELQQLKGLFMLGEFVPWLRPFDIGGIEKRMKSVQARLDTFLNKVVEDHEAKWQKGPIAEADKDMVDVLLRSMHEQDHLQESLQLDVETIKATAMSMIAAGVDTSSVMVEWAMAELMRNPRVMKTLTNELNSVVGEGRMVEEVDIPKLKYLQAVVKEVFRLHPPAPMLIPHESTHDCELAGYSIPAGTRLLVHAYAIGRKAEEWENPLQFDPERFMRRPDMDVKGQDYGLLPFGSGRRACPAINLGTMSMQWTIAVLVHAFEWSLPAGERAQDVDMSEEFGITLPSAKTLLLRARPRLDALRAYGVA